MVESKENVGSMQLTYAKKTLSAFATTNMCRATEKLVKVDINRIEDSEEISDFQNVKLTTDGADFLGELTIMDILTRKCNQTRSKSDELFR
jgi:hypothetical protein